MRGIVGVRRLGSHAGRQSGQFSRLDHYGVEGFALERIVGQKPVEPFDARWPQLLE